MVVLEIVVRTALVSTSSEPLFGARATGDPTGGLADARPGEHSATSRTVEIFNWTSPLA
jgi:hypothetical protein